ncbi:MAG: integral membrane-like protein [Paraglaciecola sp.]|uniref:spermidine synthase n=1 Tax=Paraglaciecola sp. TaxID=1920173 RepID=UPI0032990E50
MRYFLFLITIITSAFLLFQIQPILAKNLLPTWGGGSSVWTTSMLFFQSMLLLGYAHAFCLSFIKNVKSQLTLQALFLLFSLSLIPSLLKTPPYLTKISSPEASILVSLFLEIGVPFYLLSSTGVLLQHWYSKHCQQETSAYPFYAWSNLASLIALLSYPFLIEPYIGLAQQKLIWSYTYFGFVIFNLILILNLYRQQHFAVFKPLTYKNSQTSSDKHSNLTPEHFNTPTLKSKVLWMVLPLLAVVLLLSITQLLTLNISPSPLLWIVPLSLYLLSYIIGFSNLNIYQKGPWLTLFPFCVLASLLMFFFGSHFNSLSQIAMYNFILLVVAVICHGELRKIAPSSHDLPRFYLYVALGGMLGGVFVSIIAPHLFKQLTEFPIAIFGIFLILGVIYFPQPTKTLNAKGMAWCLGLLILPASYYALSHVYTRYDIANIRNFYGYLSVKEVETEHGISRRLVDGTTVHGEQLFNTAIDSTKIYYGPNTGINLALKHVQQRTSINMAVIGLGAGVLAGFGRPSDHLTFYELNPAVKYLAESQFDYLKNTQADTQIVMGDGRVSLTKALIRPKAKQSKNLLDVLIIDAFTSGAIPSHLLTLEAYEIYWKHLKDKGLLVIHTSNNHVDLVPLLFALAENDNKTASYFNTSNVSKYDYGSEWVVITNDKSFKASARTNLIEKTLKNHTSNQLIWTDDFNSLLPIMKF